MAFRVLEMVATLGMNGTRKARAEMKSTERSANSLKRALEALDRAADGWNRIERGLSRIRDEITKTRAAAAKPIVVKVKLEGDREAIGRLQTLRRLIGSLGNNSPPLEIQVDTDDARKTVERFLSWVSEQSSKITIGADTADAQNSAEVLKTYIDRLTANINVRAQIKSAVAALEFVKARASKLTGTVEVDADTSPAIARIEALIRFASGIKAEIEVGADTGEATRGIVVVRNLAAGLRNLNSKVRVTAETADATRGLLGVSEQSREVDGADPTVTARANTSDATRGLGNVLRIGGAVSAYQPNMTVNASVARALAALVGVRITGQSISRRGVVINVSTDGTPITQAQLDAVRAKAMQLGATRATVRVDQNGALATTFQLQGVNAAANQLNGRRVSFRVDAQGAKIIPVVLGDAIQQLSRLQSFMALVGAVGLPAFMTGIAGAAGAATALAGAVGSLAIGLGQGLVGAAGAAASAATLGAGALGAYGFAMFKTLSYAFNLTTMLDDQRRKIDDAAGAVKEAKKAVEEATPGTQEYATAVSGLALAEQNASFEQRKFNAMLSFATPEMIALNKEAGNLSIGFTRLGGTVANEVAPVTTRWIRGLVNLLPTVTPHLVEMIGKMNGVADSFVKTMSRGRELANLTTIFTGIKNAGAPAMQILTNILRIFVNVFSALVPTGLSVLNTFAKLTGAATKWSGTAEGQRRIAEVWEMLVGRGKQLWNVFKNLAASAAGLYTALNNSGTVDRLMTGLVNVTGQFRELLSAGGKWNTAITQGMQNAQPVLTAVWNLAKELAKQFFRVAGAVLDMGNSTGNVQTLVDVIDSLAVSAKPIADLLIGEFEHFGPLLPPLIENVGKLTETFLKSTPILLGFTDVMNTLLTAFTSLDPRTQRIAASMLAFTTLIASSGGPALVGYATQMGANIALISAMRANTIALTGAENVGLATRIRSTASLVAQKVAMVATSAATKAAAAGQWLLNVAMTANPFGIVVTAIVGLVAILVLAYRESDRFRGIVNTVFSYLKTTAITNVKALQFAIQAAWDWIKTNTPPVWNAVKAVVLGVWNALKGAASVVWNGIQAVITGSWNTLKNSATTNWNAIRAVVVGVWTAIKTTIQTNVQIVRTVVSTAWNIISQTTTRVWNGIKSFFDGLWTAIKGVFTGNTSQIKGGLSQAWAAMRQTIQVAWNGIKALFGVLWAGIKAVFLNSTAGLRQTVSNAWGQIRSATSTVWNAIKNVISGVWNSIKSLTQTVTTAIRSAVTNAWNQIKNVTTQVWNAIKQFFAAFWENQRRGFTVILGFLRNAVSTAWNFIRTTTTRVWNAIRDFFSAFWANQRRGFTVILDFLKTLVSRSWDFIRTTTTRVWNAIRDFFATFWANQRRSFTTILDALKGLVSRAWDSVRSTTTRVWNAIREFFAGWWRRLTELFRTTVDALKKRLSDGWSAMFTRAREFGGNLFNLLRDRFTSIRNAVMDRLTNLRNSASDLWTGMWNRARDFGDNIRRLLADKFAGAVNGVRKYLGLLSTAMGNVLAAIGMDKLASDLRAQGTRMQSPIRFAKGGIAGDSAASGGVKAFARGGIGSSDNKPRVHMWDEQMGPEGFAVRDRPSREQLPFIRTMAGWHDSVVVPESSIKLAGKPPGESFHTPEAMSRRTGRPASLFSGGAPSRPGSYGTHPAKNSKGIASRIDSGIRKFALGGLVDEIKASPRWPGVPVDYVSRIASYISRKFGVNDIGGYRPADAASEHSTGRALDIMTYSNMAKGNEIAKWSVDNAGPLGLKWAIWRQQINSGGGWTGMTDRGSPTQNHMDHVHDFFTGGPGGAGGFISGAIGAVGGAISSVTDKLGKTWNSVTDFMGHYFKPPSIPDVGLGEFGGGIKDYLGSMAGKVKDWLTDKATELLGLGGGGGSGDGSWSGGGNVKQWISDGLKLGGVFSATSGNISKMYGRVMQESGGDPNAVNNWDINAQNGTPSKGLVQIIKGTWEAWRNRPGPDAGGFDANWMNPIKSVAVSSRYMKGVYGYLVGSNGQGYDKGGIIPGMKGAAKLVMGHSGERVLPIPAVDAFDRLTNSLVLWSRTTPAVGQMMGSAGVGRAAAPPVGMIDTGARSGATVNITQDFSGLSVGENVSVEEIMEMARRGGEAGAEAALGKLGAKRHKVSNRIASGRS